MCLVRKWKCVLKFLSSLPPSAHWRHHSHACFPFHVGSWWLIAWAFPTASTKSLPMDRSCVWGDTHLPPLSPLFYHGVTGTGMRTVVSVSPIHLRAFIITGPHTGDSGVRGGSYVFILTALDCGSIMWPLFMKSSDVAPECYYIWLCHPRKSWCFPCSILFLEASQNCHFCLLLTLDYNSDQACSSVLSFDASRTYITAS